MTQPLATPYSELEQYLTEEERAELLKLLASDNRIFYPNPGPQFMAATSAADIIGFGGSAGGGKSYLITGLAITEHKRSVIFRQHKNQTQKFVQDFNKLLGSAAGYSSQNSQWKLPIPPTKDDPNPGERLIEFAGLEDPNDHQKWQGRDHSLKCVGAGTLIWMADGSRKPIERIEAGEHVATLEGPRRVSRTFCFHKPAVRVVTAYGAQVQSADHRLLTPIGWRSVDDVRRPSAFSSPISHRAARTVARWFATTCSRLASILAGRHAVWAQLPGLFPDREDRQASSGAFAGAADTSLESAFARSNASSRASWRRALFRLFGQAPLRLRPAPAGFASPGHAGDGDALGARPRSSPPDFLERCSFDTHPDGGRPRLSARADPPYPHRSGDVERRSPSCLLVDARQPTPKHSRHRWSYAHPYTKETRRSDLSVRIVSFRHFDVGVQPLYDLTVEGANHYLAGPGFVNRNCYDEATQMRESDVRYTMGWCRSDDPNERCRVLLTFNPPTTAEGRWVIRFFAPWLDKTHPNPAKSGELRWFTTIDGDQDYELPDGRPFVRREDGSFDYDFDPALYAGPLATRIIRPKSRTFIASRVTDNPYYMATGYVQTLQALPEPLRSQMLEGDFMAGVEDDAMQLIPTAWVEEAQELWTKLTGHIDFKLGEQLSLGVDAARGGNMGSTTGAVGRDKMVIVPRYLVAGVRFFDRIVAIPGIDVNTGNLAAAQILAQRRDGAPVHLDVVGVGTSVFDALQENRIQTVAINGTAKAFGVAHGNGLRFYNKRAEIHWRMREALDPANPVRTALPPDTELLADLTAPRWWLSSTGIRIEEKLEIKARIGRSPDKGEACMYANIDTAKLQLVPKPFSGISGSTYDTDRLKELEG